MKSLPPISILIVTLNSERTIERCLHYIKSQNYSMIYEVLIVDGGSTDNTIKIAKNSRLPIRIVKGGYKNNQEARRYIGVKKAKSEIIAMIDTDNFILDKNWLKEMVRPLIENDDVVASQTLRYAVPSGASLFNRYFGLIGAGDPVAYYLGKDDRLSWAFDKWNLLGKVIKKINNYIIIDFDPKNYQTLGCNGIVFRKSVILKADIRRPSDYIHTDVFVDIGNKGFTKFAVVNNEVFHNTAENVFNFISKRRRYMRIYHQVLNKKRRHLTFDIHRMKDVLRLIMFIVFAATIIEPLFESIRGYLKKRDIAWFLHPIVCIGIMFVYLEMTISRFITKI